MKKWSVLSKNDRVCIVAPAYGVAYANEVDNATKQAEDIVKKYELVPLVKNNMLIPNNHTLFNATNLKFANSDEMRLAGFIDALNDPDCNAVWCFRGGYGAIRILDGLYKQVEPEKVKPVIGFSDITILHTFLNTQWGWPSIHFGMPGALQDVMVKQESIDSLQKILFGELSIIEFNLYGININASNDLEILGEVCGGNKLNVQRTLGTIFQPNFTNKIVVLEEEGEEPRWLDGFLLQFQSLRDFSEISAIIFGTILPEDKEESFIKIINDFAKNINVPVFRFFQENTIGHGTTNKALPMGVPAKINFDESINNYKLLVESGENHDIFINSYNEL